MIYLLIRSLSITIFSLPFVLVALLSLHHPSPLFFYFISFPFLYCYSLTHTPLLPGQVPVGLIVLNAGQEGNEEAVVKGVVAKVRETLGPVAAFKSAGVVAGLPKTRSGKILRGVIQKIANGEDYKLPGTIEDVAPVEWVKEALAVLEYPQSTE